MKTKFTEKYIMIIPVSLSVSINSFGIGVAIKFKQLDKLLLNKE